jgi:uncharacterized protein (DUF1697 family)
MRYVAFLRGINVGGRKPLRMADLRKAFEDLGFADVRTVQTSGNVVFEAGGEEDFGAVAALIETELERMLNAPICAIVRPLADLERLVASDPFRFVPITSETRLYVTFLSRPAMSPKTVDGNVRLVGATAGEVLTAITLSPRWGTTELMAWLEEEFGKGLTTRNWNTITKIVAS